MFIYGLAEPDGSEIRYIGKAQDPWFRYRSHLKLTSLRLGGYKNSWLKSVLARGEQPLLVLLDVCEGDGCQEERWYIAEFRANGARLTNTTDGGEGTLGYRPSAETRARMAKAQTGRKHSAETRAKIAAGNRGPKSAQARKRMSEAKRNQSLETRMKISVAKKGKPRTMTPKARAQVSRKDALGRWCST